MVKVTVNTFDCFLKPWKVKLLFSLIFEVFCTLKVLILSLSSKVLLFMNLWL
jgi:hypothetical protein